MPLQMTLIHNLTWLPCLLVLSVALLCALIDRGPFMPKIFQISEEILTTFSAYRWQTCICMLRKLFAFVDRTASVVCVIKYLALLQFMSVGKR